MSPICPHCSASTSLVNGERFCRRLGCGWWESADCPPAGENGSAESLAAPVEPGQRAGTLRTAAQHTPVSVAALYVERDGAYFGVPGVDPWDEARDARKYAGPHPVVAHPPCQRWGRFWHGSARKPHQFKLGDDGGCFEAAFKALRRFGGVLEHPADSHAWAAFGLNKPPRAGGWVYAGHGCWTCCVYQGQYGHLAGKPTWLLACGMQPSELPQLRWGKTEQRIHPRALELHGYEKARRIGMMAMVGGKDKTRIRNATPPDFRAVLLDLACAAIAKAEGSASRVC